MHDQNVLAQINLFAVLGCLPALCRLDKQAKNLIASQQVRIKFKIWHGPALTLEFADGGCRRLADNASAHILLMFKNPAHFNAMMAGQANPILLKGFTRIGFLKGAFTQLTARLEAVLKPAEESLSDMSFRVVNTELTLNVAAAAAVQVANHDPFVRSVVAAMPHGDITLMIQEGPSLSIRVGKQGLSLLDSASLKPRAQMTFVNVAAAFDLLNGRLDSFTSIATERLFLAGMIPMLEGLDKLLFRVNRYM